MHQAGLLGVIRELNAPASFLFANDQILIGEARLAFIMGDQPAHNKHMEEKSKSCRMCLCPCDKLNSTDEMFLAFDWRAC